MTDEGRDTIVAELAKLTTPEPITRANIDTLLNTYQLEIHLKNGRWWTCRRNGKTRHWARSPNRIYVPFKYGFRNYGNVTENDFREDGSLNPFEFRVKPTIAE